MDIDWSFLVGGQLTQLCIGGCDVILRFDDKISITMMGDDATEDYFQHKTASPSSSAVKGMPGRAVSLVSLIGATVQKVVAENNTTLAIYLSNAEELRIFDTSDSYESFTVDGAPGGTIVV